MTARLTLILCVLLLSAPASALAQDNPFGPIPQAPPQQTAPPDDGTNSVNDEDEGLSRRQELLIGGAGLVLLFGIGWAIVRDARSAAPAEHHLTEAEGGTASRGTRKPKDQRVKQQRAAAKRARQARKRNR